MSKNGKETKTNAHQKHGISNDWPSEYMNKNSLRASSGTMGYADNHSRDQLKRAAFNDMNTLLPKDLNNFSNAPLKDIGKMESKQEARMVVDTIAKVNDRKVYREAIEIQDQTDDFHNQYKKILGKEYI